MPNLEQGKVPEDWWYFPVVARLHNERTGYPTQKPEALLERIILASSNPGDLVADFFCGSGTTAVTAVRHGRTFLASDASWRAVHTTRARLVSLPCGPFTLERARSASIPVRRAKMEEFGLSLAEGEVRLRPHADIVYWEVGYEDRKGRLHSGAQAVRPARNGQIAEALPLGRRKTGLGPVRVRLGLAGGEVLDARLDR